MTLPLNTLFWNHDDGVDENRIIKSCLEQMFCNAHIMSNTEIRVFFFFLNEGKIEKGHFEVFLLQINVTITLHTNEIRAIVTDRYNARKYNSTF